MTKKDFEAIARAIKAQVDELPQNAEGAAARWTIFDTALNLSVVFLNANPRFDKDRFLKACGFMQD